MHRHWTMIDHNSSIAFSHFLLFLSLYQKWSALGSLNFKEFLHVLGASNFSFSHSVFKRLVLQTCKNHSLFGKGMLKKIPFHYSSNGSLLRNESCEHFLKRTSRGTFLPSLVQADPAVWEMFTEIVDSPRRTTDMPKSYP